jgi:primase-polymerase (primpol)-like protein
VSQEERRDVRPRSFFLNDRRSSEIDAIYSEIFAPIPPAELVPVPQRSLDLNDEDLLQKMFASASGLGIQRLWKGDMSAYETHSHADAALAAHLAFWTDHDASRIDALFRQSGLMRRKWNRMHGTATYGDRTVSMAIRATAAGYTRSRAAPTGAYLSLRERRYLIEHGADDYTIAVLNVILLHRDDQTGWCMATAETIAADGPMSESTALERIWRLRTTGVIEERIKADAGLTPPRLRRMRPMAEWPRTLSLATKRRRIRRGP